jgi:hypothetical protein
MKNIEGRLIVRENSGYWDLSIFDQVQCDVCVRGDITLVKLEGYVCMFVKLATFDSIHLHLLSSLICFDALRCIKPFVAATMACDFEYFEMLALVVTVGLTISSQLHIHFFVIPFFLIDVCKRDAIIGSSHKAHGALLPVCERIGSSHHRFRIIVLSL